MEKVKGMLHQAEAYIRNYYQHILSAALIMLLVIIVYGRDLEILLNEALQSEAVSYVLLIPFFEGVLFYLKRDMVKASLAWEKLRKKPVAQYLDDVVGVALCLIAFLFYWYGSHTFYPLEFHLLSIPIFTAGIVLILFNWKTLTALIFPILLLLFLTPPPTEFMFTIGGTLANFNTQAAHTLLKTFGLPVTLTSSYGPPTIALTSSTGEPLAFAIDLPCAGTYSLTAFVIFAAVLAVAASTPTLKKIDLFVLGLAIFEILNIVRIATIVCVGYWFGEEVAMLVFHTIAGLSLIFVGMLLILAIAEKILKIQVFPTSRQETNCPECRASLDNFENFCSNCSRYLSLFQTRISQRFWAKLFLLLLGCSIITLTVQAPTFAVAQRSVEVASGWQKAADVFPSKVVSQDINYTIKFLYRDTGFEKLANQDAHLMYAYLPDKPNPIREVFVNLGVASSISNLHSWEVCLIAIQTAHGRYPLVSTQDSRDIQLLEDVPLIARYLVFKDEQGIYLPENHTQVTLYWYERATFNTGITVEQKYARISLIIVTESTEYRQFEEALLAFGQHIAAHWQPLKMQSVVSLGVPAQQLLLALSIGFVAFTKSVQNLQESRRRSNNLKIFNRYSPPEEKGVLQTILNLSREKKRIETKDIVEAIEKKRGERIETRKLLQTLSNLEENGFIEKDIVSVKSTPRLVWKNQLSGIYKP